MATDADIYALARPASKKRTVNKAGSRLALLEATADVILKYGISSTTISRIQAASGLSRGMINMHFESKEGLITALAGHFHEEYEAAWKAAMACAVDTPEERLKAIFVCEFSEELLNTRMSAIWAALRSEYNVRPELRPFVETRDLQLYREIHSCIRRISPETVTPAQRRRITIAIMSTMEGLLLDYSLHPSNFDRAEAAETCFFAAMRMCA